MGVTVRKERIEDRKGQRKMARRLGVIKFVKKREE